MGRNDKSPLLENIEDQDIDVGSRLRVIRTNQGLSIRALAERSGLNVNTLSLIENGKTSPSVSTLQALAQSLAVPISLRVLTFKPLRSARARMDSPWLVRMTRSREPTSMSWSSIFSSRGDLSLRPIQVASGKS
ncbi:MAG: helix-turn-helix transcriptional regulator [Anaerolineales bacterium]